MRVRDLTPQHEGHLVRLYVHNTTYEGRLEYALTTTTAFEDGRLAGLASMGPGISTTKVLLDMVGFESLPADTQVEILN